MTSAAPAVEPLSLAMRSGSRAEHEDAEASPFLTELLAGRVDEAGYAAYLGRLWHVYAALEASVGRRRDEPLVAAVHDPALERLGALEADLAFWSGRAGAPAAPAAPTPAVIAYTERVTSGTGWAGLLVAHHYTRYLGDLSGGQVIGRLLRRHFEVEGDGLAFYDFPRIPQPKRYRDGYRRRLDALDLTTSERAALVEEVRTAFRLNHALLDELGAMRTAGRR